MAPHYARGGRPSVDPELLLRMLPVGYLYGVRSERRLCEEVDPNLACRRFCRLGLDGRAPDHSTFTKNRHGRFRESGPMRELFERVVERCLAGCLAHVDVVAVGGTHIAVSVGTERLVRSADELPREGDGATRAVREYFADLDVAAPGPPGTTRQKPAAISVTDPSSALSTRYGKKAFAYGLNAIIDTAPGVVLDVEAASARTADESEAAWRMVERTNERHGRLPQILTANAAYGSGHFMAWAEGHGIAPHMPLADSCMGTGRLYPKSAFAYDAERDVHICLAGKLLERSRKMRGAGPERWSGGLAMSYGAKRRDCGPCPFKQGCCSNSTVRRPQRFIYEPARDRGPARIGTPVFVRSQRLRLRVERRFACIKHNDGLRLVRLQRQHGADEQFTLAAIARNLKVMARRLTPASPAA
jgi:transposase